VVKILGGLVIKGGGETGTDRLIQNENLTIDDWVMRFTVKGLELWDA